MKVVTLTPEEEKVIAKLRRDSLKASAIPKPSEVVRAKVAEPPKVSPLDSIYAQHDADGNRVQAAETTPRHRVGKPRKNDSGEWEVPWFENGKRHEGKTYYTDDKGDAHDTHAHMSRQADEMNKASDHSNAATVTAAGTSEGVKKGWQVRQHSEGETHHYLHPSGVSGAVHIEDVIPEKGQKSSTLYHAVASRRQGGGNIGHVSTHNSLQEAKSAVETYLHHPVFGVTSAELNDAMNTSIIHCRDYSASNVNLAVDSWKPGETVEFMWMPAGVHQIRAGFRKGSIQLNVRCDETTASAVQASLEAWRAERPKQEPFGCIEHREQEASVRVSAGGGFAWRNDGVYLAAEPTTLGAENVNGRIHRSWSPSFTTDADYHLATEQPKGSGNLVFPPNARGGANNPAEITGVDFCVGTLTNKPAFHAMSPVKGSEEDDAVTASGNSEGAKKGWQVRQHSEGETHHYIHPSGVSGAVHIEDVIPEEGKKSATLYHAVASRRQGGGNIGHVSTHDSLQKAKSAVENYLHHPVFGVTASESTSDSTLRASGTSEGAKKGWEHRAGLASLATEAAKRSEKSATDAPSFESHNAASDAHWYASKKHRDAAVEAHREGKNVEELDHQTKSDEHIRKSDFHAVESFSVGAKHRASESYKRIKEAVSNKATDATASNTLHAHCGAQIFLNIPDATAAEEAEYDKMVDGGMDVASAVEFIKNARRNGVDPAKATEKPTLDAIYAAHAAKVAEAERIAAEEHERKMAKVYEAAGIVTATGTSEGVKKGWEYRKRFSETAEAHGKKMKLIGGWQDLAAYYEGDDKNAWKYQNGSFVNMGDIGEFRSNFAKRHRGVLEN